MPIAMPHPGAELLGIWVNGQVWTRLFGRRRLAVGYRKQAPLLWRGTAFRPARIHEAKLERRIERVCRLRLLEMTEREWKKLSTK